MLDEAKMIPVLMICLVHILVSSAIQIEDPVSEDLEIYTPEENQCLSNRKFLFRGKCYTLLTKGPCPRGEWLVLESPGTFKRPLKVICQKKPCTTHREVWWAEDGRCVRKSWLMKNHCRGNGRTVTVDPYGRGKCSCLEYHGELTGGDDCHEFYQRGPCEPSQVVVYDKPTGYAKCSKDLCLQNTDKNRKLYAPMDGIGECHRLGSAQPCKQYGDQSRYVLDFFTNVPGCSTYSWELKLIDIPALCKFDDNKKCRSPVDVKNDDRLTFILKMEKEEFDYKTLKNKTIVKDNSTLIDTIMKSNQTMNDTAMITKPTKNLTMDHVIVNASDNITTVNKTILHLNDTGIINQNVPDPINKTVIVSPDVKDNHINSTLTEEIHQKNITIVKIETKPKINTTTPETFNITISTNYAMFNETKNNTKLNNSTSVMGT